MDDARTVFGSDIVSGYDGEGWVWEGQAWDGEQLFVFPSDHGFSFKLLQQLVRNQFVAWIIGIEREFGCFRGKVSG